MKHLLKKKKQMLSGDFFTIERISERGEETLFLTALNPHHKIFDGHFPGDPICPGVCNIQTIRECAEQKTGKKLRIDAIALCRFSALITPQACPQLLISLQLGDETEDTIPVTAKITSPDEQKIYLEYKGSYGIEKTLV